MNIVKRLDAEGIASHSNGVLLLVVEAEGEHSAELVDKALSLDGKEGEHYLYLRVGIEGIALLYQLITKLTVIIYLAVEDANVSVSILKGLTSLFKIDDTESAEGNGKIFEFKSLILIRSSVSNGT